MYNKCGTLFMCLRSGTAEQYDELDKLLQDLSDRINVHKFSQQGKKIKAANKRGVEVEAAEFVRNAATSGMNRLPNKGTYLFYIYKI